MEVAQFLVPFAVAAIVAALSTPLVSRLARAFGAVDRPNERKVSSRADMPLMGGLAVALGCGVGLAAAMMFIGEHETVTIERIEGFLVGGMVVLAIGALDDRWTVNAWPKLIFQLIAAVIAISYGFVITGFREPLTEVSYDLPFWFGALVTTVWIVAVSNAMNLIDGLDGLSTGVGAIICATLAVICLQAEQLTGLLLGVVLVGALLGFLPFNFPPARIFLGDTGALFIGYALSLVALEGYEGGYRKASVMAFIVPMLALAVPLLDTGLSILRRVRAGKPIFDADRHHMHHRLLESEGSDRGAVVALYFLTGCFCVIAVSFTRLEGLAAVVFLIAVVGLTVRLLRNLGIYAAGRSDSELGAPTQPTLPDHGGPPGREREST